MAPRSRCPGCGHKIRWHENVPIVSWLVLRGRCGGCGGAISPQYILVELLIGLGWLLAFWAYGPTFTALRLAVFGTIMAGVAITDALHYLIPDGFTISGLLWVLGTAVAELFMRASGDSPSPFAAPADALLGACAAAGAVAIIGWLGEAALKKEAMGFGDVTLMAMAGAHLGVARGLMTIFLGAALGAVAFLVIVFPIAWLRSRRAGREFEPPLVPFGVFLAPAAMVALLWGDALLNWYRGLTGL